ncbi:MAG: phage portal protein family protein [Armatimonadota bacterium]
MPGSIISRLVDVLSFRRSPPLSEIARARGYVNTSFNGIQPFSTDDLVGKHGWAVYERMQHDAQVQACLNIKKSAVLARGWQVHPSSESEEAIRTAEFVQFVLEDMRGSIMDVLANAMDAIAKGFSVMEINYRIIDRPPYDGLIGIASIKSKDPSTFAFETDEFLNIRSLKRVSDCVSSAAVGRDEFLPPEKFVIYSYNPRYESPYGTSDLRAAYKHYWSKDVLMRFMNLYLEKYGSPTAKGSYRRGTPKAAQEELLRVLERIQQETAIVIPEDVQVELLEAHRGGEAGYLQALEFHDKQIAKAILNQTLMTDEGMRVGSFALAKVHLEVLKMCLAKLKRDLEETIMREQVIKRLVDYNFRTNEYPAFSLGPLEDRDLESLANAVSKLVGGEVVRPDEVWIREYLGLPAAGAKSKVRL